MNFVNRDTRPADSQGYEDHAQATAHGMCEDTEFMCVEGGEFAEATCEVDDKIDAALELLQQARELSEKKYADLREKTFKVDVAWAAPEGGAPILAVVHEVILTKWICDQYRF